MANLTQDTKDLLLSALGSPEARDDVVDAIESSGGGEVDSVTASSPLSSSGGVNPNISFTGTLPIANGGTGQTTASNAINALMPSQTGNSGKALTTNGSVISWATFISAPAGSNTQIQFNDSSSFGGSANFTFNKTTHSLTQGASSNTAPGSNSTALGNGTTASGTNTFSCGRSSNVGVLGLASGLNSSVLGLDCIASAPQAHAYGNTTTASGTNSKASGNLTVADSTNSSAEGLSTTADANQATARGDGSHAGGVNSFASGLDSETFGNSAHAMGNGLSADADYQTVVGQFNIAVGTPGAPASTDHVFTVGNGTNNASRNNAFYVRRDGAIVYPTPIVPATASDTGTVGQIAYDANYIYICTSTDTWKRTSLASF